MTRASEEYGFSHLISPEERKEIIRRAKQRAQKQVQEREHLRLEIDARACIFRMMEIRDTLTKGHEPSQNIEGVEEQLSPDRVSALKAAADISDKLLSKVLPNLKPIEMAALQQQPNEVTDDDIALANKLRIWREQKNGGD